MKKGLNSQLEATFLDNNALHAQYLRSPYFFHMFKEHANGKADHAHALWGTFVVARWLDQALKPVDESCSEWEKGWRFSKKSGDRTR